MVRLALTLTEGYEYINTDILAIRFYHGLIVRNMRSMGLSYQSDFTDEACQRAENLLKEYIGAEAFRKFCDDGYIEVDSKGYKRKKYRISRYGNSMIEVYDKGKFTYCLCARPAVDCPPADRVLSKVVLLQSAEEYFLSKANLFYPHQLTRLWRYE